MYPSISSKKEINCLSYRIWPLHSPIVFTSMENHLCSWFVYWSWCVMEVEWQSWMLLMLPRWESHSRAMTNGTQESECLELIVLKQNDISHRSPSIVSFLFCLFPPALSRNSLLLERAQPQRRAFTTEQFGNDPNPLCKKKGINGKPESSSFFPWFVRGIYSFLRRTRWSSLKPST